MRVWDISPGYLNRQSLLGEHREIHALLVILSEGRSGYANHPETQRWRGHLPALAARHAWVAEEMHLRGYKERSPVSEFTAGEGAFGQGEDWAPSYVTQPAEQFALLGGKYQGREAGRIPLPQNAQQLWAQHKYSVMARDLQAYRDVGRALAGPASRASPTGLPLADLAALLVTILRQRPGAGGVRNVLEHLWGYIGDSAAPALRERRATLLWEEPRALLSAIWMEAQRQRAGYLLTSTVFSDLLVPWPSDAQEPAAVDRPRGS